MEQCPATEVVNVVGDDRLFFRCIREANHRGQHFASARNGSQLYWHEGWREEAKPDRTDITLPTPVPTEVPGVGPGVLVWVLGSLVVTVLLVTSCVVWLNS